VALPRLNKVFDHVTSQCSFVGNSYTAWIDVERLKQVCELGGWAFCILIL
jgi:hypothetical protein